MKIALRVSALILIAINLVGFRTFSPNTWWEVQKTSAKIFVKFCSTPTIGTNDLPTSDPLYGQALTFANVTQAIFDDFNNVASSYIQLVDVNDPDFGVLGPTRTIEICFETQISGGGVAQAKKDGDYVRSCTIKLTPSLAESAKNFTATMTHEIGHCLGLDHSQETVYSIMSYFSGDRAIRLQDDDKMGLIYLYPTEDRFRDEKATFGTSCAPSEE